MFPARPAFIIDDTADIAAYATDAPMSPTGLLSFVNVARPLRATAMSVSVIDDTIYDLYEAAA